MAPRGTFLGTLGGRGPSAGSIVTVDSWRWDRTLRVTARACQGNGRDAHRSHSARGAPHRPAPGLSSRLHHCPGRVREGPRTLATPARVGVARGTVADPPHDALADRGQPEQRESNVELPAG